MRASLTVICTLPLACCTQRFAPELDVSQRDVVRDSGADQLLPGDRKPDTRSRADLTLKDILPSADLPISLAKVAIPGFGIQVTVGDSAKLSAEATWTDGSMSDVTFLASWSSSDPYVATVGNGQGQGGTVSGMHVGVAQITATYQGVSSAPLTVTVPNSDQFPQIWIAPSSMVIAVGDTAKLTVLTVVGGTTYDLTSVCAWSTNAPAIIKLAVTPNLGQITALAPGSATVTATYSGLSVSASVGVK